MSIHFAAAHRPGRAPATVPIARALASRALENVANDNELQIETSQSRPLADDGLLRAALRHFAEHGLGAARAAHVEAERAFFAGDRSTYDWWVGITRALDRRMAEELVALQG
jgi:hypothetical protein